MASYANYPDGASFGSGVHTEAQDVLGQYSISVSSTDTKYVVTIDNRLLVEGNYFYYGYRVYIGDQYSNAVALTSSCSYGTTLVNTTRTYTYTKGSSATTHNITIGYEGYTTSVGYGAGSGSGSKTLTITVPAVSKKYTIKFNTVKCLEDTELWLDEDDVTKISSKKVISGNTFTFPSLDLEEYNSMDTSLSFAGWSTSLSSGTIYKAGATSPTVTSDKTYYAIFTTEVGYATTYKISGSSATITLPSPTVMYYGKRGGTISSTIPTLSGQIFAGWMLEENSTTIYQPGDKFYPTYETNLYAKWVTTSPPIVKSISSTYDKTNSQFSISVSYENGPLSTAQYYLNTDTDWNSISITDTSSTTGTFTFITKTVESGLLYDITVKLSKIVDDEESSSQSTFSNMNADTPTDIENNVKTLGGFIYNGDGTATYCEIFVYNGDGSASVPDILAEVKSVSTDKKSITFDYCIPYTKR